MKKFQAAEIPNRKMAPRWAVIAFISLLYVCSYFFYEKLEPVLFGVLGGALILKVIEFLLPGNSKKYLIFGKENIVFGSDDCTYWHVNYNNISHIGSEKVTGFDPVYFNMPDHVFLYTLNNDKFLLNFSEDQLNKIKAEIYKVKEELNKAKGL